MPCIQKTLKTSRIIIQRCYHHDKKNNQKPKHRKKPTSSQLQIESTQKMHKSRIDNYCSGKFVFIPNLKQKLENIRKVIGDMTLQTCHSYRSNMKCHYLCTIKSLQSNMASLLGLGPSSDAIFDCSDFIVQR